ncbi:MAG: hypothetical protein ACPGUD_12750 [Parashewanella sp.]
MATVEPNVAIKIIELQAEPDPKSFGLDAAETPPNVSINDTNYQAQASIPTLEPNKVSTFQQQRDANSSGSDRARVEATSGSNQSTPRSVHISFNNNTDRHTERQSTKPTRIYQHKQFKDLTLSLIFCAAIAFVLFLSVGIYAAVETSKNTTMSS